MATPTAEYLASLPPSYWAKAFRDFRHQPTMLSKLVMFNKPCLACQPARITISAPAEPAPGDRQYTTGD